MPSQPSDPVLACNIAAIPKAFRPVHQANTERIFAKAQEVRELSTGYAWRLANETDLLPTVGAFLSYERLCCPFFHFRLEIEPDQGPVWLQITGVIDVKAFLRDEGWVPSTSGSPSESEVVPRHGQMFQLSGTLCDRTIKYKYVRNKIKSRI